jgi:PD-(D/E)XK nuclease superfamily protein
VTDQFESDLRQSFETNYESLRLEGGHSITREFKELAWQQVLAYSRKLREIAEAVTETEVKLVLPNQNSPEKRPYSIEGVVDIVQQNERTVMYDIKTHDPGYIEAHLGEYEKQLNVYAHIWHGIRGQPLDEIAIISTALPSALRSAFNGDDPEAIQLEMAKWRPIFRVPLDSGHVEATIAEFGAVVDKIEDRQFPPAPIKKLKKQAGEAQAFATRVCRNCEGRFSCDSYRDYVRSGSVRPRFDFSLFDSNVEETEQLDTTLAEL